ncbi:hypothetical protein B1400_1364 [Bifidobacterium italicum]|uniref:DUF2513 domain-containing protein n=1 Tax=Bifidobacterium italicum TaxID=1960968 RepID=A0A2A2EIJ6_9BIFI|nr:DUF2513 domain-containing protein [Bifidobacterium italicum]PAU68746.1 hypothetical protein B1400_1364 [Bifidobacterium italicum]
MRRDMDLIRHILIMVGDSPVPLNATVFVDEAHPFETVAYHIDLIGQAGLADTSITRMSGKAIARAEVSPLAWNGNESLDAIRSDTIWSRVKQRVGATWSMYFTSTMTIR